MFCARSRQTPAIQKVELDSSVFRYEAARDAYVCPERWPGGTDGQPVLGRIVARDGRPIRGAGGYRSFLSSQLVASVIASATSFSISQQTSSCTHSAASRL